MTLIETESENASVLKESNPLEKVLVWQHKEIWREDKLDLSFVYGIKPYLQLDPSMDQWRGQSEGNLIRDLSFQPEKQQKELLTLCDAYEAYAEKNFRLLHCFPRRLAQWLEEQGIEYPVPESDFHAHALKFFYDEHVSANEKSVGFIDGKLVMMQIDFDYLEPGKENEELYKVYQKIELMLNGQQY